MKQDTGWRTTEQGNHIKIKNGEVVAPKEAADAINGVEQKGGSDKFDDDYEEEFGNINKSMSKDWFGASHDDSRPNHNKIKDLGLNDSELSNMIQKYLSSEELNDLRNEYDVDSNSLLKVDDMLKYMSDDDIGDMMRINGLDEDEEDSELREKMHQEMKEKLGNKYDPMEADAIIGGELLDRNNNTGKSISAAEDDLGIKVLDSKENFLKVAKWLKTNGYADDIGNAYRIIEDSLNNEGKNKLDKLLNDKPESTFEIDDGPSEQPKPEKKKSDAQLISQYMKAWNESIKEVDSIEEAGDLALSIADDIAYDNGYSADEDEKKFNEYTNMLANKIEEKILKRRPQIKKQDLQRKLGSILMPPRK